MVWHIQHNKSTWDARVCPRQRFLYPKIKQFKSALKIYSNFIQTPSQTSSQGPKCQTPATSQTLTSSSQTLTISLSQT